jgi:hypothetical protein
MGNLGVNQTGWVQRLRPPLTSALSCPPRPCSKFHHSPREQGLLPFFLGHESGAQEGRSFSPCCGAMRWRPPSEQALPLITTPRSSLSTEDVEAQRGTEIAPGCTAILGLGRGVGRETQSPCLERWETECIFSRREGGTRFCVCVCVCVCARVPRASLTWTGRRRPASR